jgi:bacterioferritin-associated ferredoxin
MAGWRMPRVLAVMMLGAATHSWSGQAHAQEPPTDNCLSCHSVLDDERLSAPAKAFPADIHAVRGLGCSACHGGDPAAGFDGMDPAKGFLGRPGRRRSVDLCGRCHSDAAFMRQYNPSLRVDQVAEYVTSVHGRRLVELGDTAVAVCTNCHPAHAITPPTDPASSVNPLNVANTCGTCHSQADYMQPYGLATDQQEKYLRSVHWEAMSVRRDLSAPTCNDCHGNHGAAPPGISWVGNVCGQCHSVMADYFAQSRHASTFAMLGVPGCATCHNNHEIQWAGDTLLGLGEGAVCGRCHAAGDGGGETARAMRTLVDSLRTAFDSAHAKLLKAERAGMEVSQPLFELGGANNALITARASVHSFEVLNVKEPVDEGLAITATAQSRGEEALGELRFRRAGLVISVTIILALILGLLLKIRDIERAKSTT